MASSLYLPPPVPNRLIDLDQSEVGVIVADGVVDTAGNCDISQFKFKLAVPADGKTVWSAIEFKANCQVFLAGKWKGLLKDGPEIIVNPEPGVQLTSSLDESQVDKEVSQVTTSGTKTSKQEVFMYGGGGTGDKLTSVTADATFSWNGVQAWVTSAGKTCWGSSAFYPNWWWDDNYCGSSYGSSTPSDPWAWFLAEGDFSCYPSWVFPCSASQPDGYYHTLANYITTNINGKADCSF